MPDFVLIIQTHDLIQICFLFIIEVLWIKFINDSGPTFLIIIVKLLITILLRLHQKSFIICSRAKLFNRNIFYRSKLRKTMSNWRKFCFSINLNLFFCIIQSQTGYILHSIIGLRRSFFYNKSNNKNDNYYRRNNNA